MIDIFKLHYYKSSSYGETEKFNCTIEVLVPEYFLLLDSLNYKASGEYLVIRNGSSKLPIIGSINYGGLYLDDINIIKASINNINREFNNSVIELKYYDEHKVFVTENKVLETNEDIRYAYERGGKLNNNLKPSRINIYVHREGKFVYVIGSTKYKQLARLLNYNNIAELDDNIPVLIKPSITKLYTDVIELDEHISKIKYVYGIGAKGIVKESIHHMNPEIEYFLTIDDAKTYYNIINTDNNENTLPKIIEKKVEEIDWTEIWNNVLEGFIKNKKRS